MSRILQKLWHFQLFCGLHIFYVKTVLLQGVEFFCGCFEHVLDVKVGKPKQIALL